MRVFITVGSTKFDALVQLVLSQEVLDAFRVKGYKDIVVQCGNSRTDILRGNDTTEFENDGAKIVVYRFKPSLEIDYATADLIISHAGALWLYHLNLGLHAQSRFGNDS
jgi:beta-1,4-N-acetylglucosaminyltransferase